MSGHDLAVTTGTTSLDEVFLQEALALAARIPTRPWPNPPVGAVVVKDGVVVGRAAHHGAGTAHAERLALAEAGDRARGATLYCTLEPCRHHGRTPPCTDAILEAGVSRVVAGVRDPNPPASGGAALLRDAGLEVVLGVLADRCLDLIWPFVVTDAFARPYVELKTATSLDGRFAGPRDPAGRPRYLTGAPARRAVHERRRWHDLVLVGAGTARHDRPRLDTRLVGDGAPCPDAEPLAACATSGRSRPGPSPLSLDRPDWLCFHPAGTSPRVSMGARLVVCPGGADGGVDPAGLLAACAERGLTTIYLEGGPTLAGSFLAAGLVDRWVQFTAPLLLGEGPAWPARSVEPAAGGYSLTRAGRVGDDLCAVWDRRDFGAALAVLGATAGGGR